MAYSRDDMSAGTAEGQILKAPRAATRSDIFPKLVMMQRQLKARHFAVFRVAGAGLPNKRKLVCELENWGPSSIENCLRFLDTYGDMLLSHIDASMLPLTWHGNDEASFVEMAEFSNLTTRMEGGLLGFSGIAFPARLGTIGNGYVIFCATSIDLSSELVVDHHLKSCQVMMDILTLDERRSATAETLSEREIACLQLAGDGRISEEIAEKLGLSVHTVNAYLGSATIKLNSVNRIQAIAKAIRLGYIH